MEKMEITLALDSEKMKALEFYLGKENATAQRKMDEALRQLYEKTVPEPVREYLDAKSTPATPKRPVRAAAPKSRPEPAKAAVIPAGQVSLAKEEET